MLIDVLTRFHDMSGHCIEYRQRFCRKSGTKLFVAFIVQFH